MLANTCVALTRFCGFLCKHIFTLLRLFARFLRGFCAVFARFALRLHFYAFTQRFSQIAPCLDSEALLARGARQVSDYTLPFARF